MFLVVGSDRFGAFHARQLRRAGRTDVEEVDGDYLAAVGSWLAAAGPEDHLVPNPLQPHLLWTWLAAELGLAAGAAPAGWGMPYETTGSDGALYISAAAWTCPATCVEPAHCPVLHAPRDWDLGDMIEAGARERGYEPAVFRCLHLLAGVGTVPAGSILEARERLRGASRVLVATSSRCHAAMGALGR